MIMMEREDIDLERGDEEIAFIRLGEELDSSEMLEQAENPRERIEKELARRGIEWENTRIAAIFQDEISLHLEDEAEIKLDGEKIYPEGDQR